jgi:putative CocE/NonD family hydrolase
MTIFLGPWNHGADLDSNPYAEREAPLSISVEEQQSLMVGFLDQYLKTAAAPAPVRKIVYYTMGEEVRKETAIWPPAGTMTKSFYLRDNHVLSSALPAPGEAPDRYLVDYTASTGDDNGWWTKLFSADVFYGDRKSEDEKLLVYTTAPLEVDTEITGHPSVTLFLSSTETDGAIFAYLEDVAPDGTVTYVTEGQLRLLHRKLCTPGARAPYGPCHSFLAQDAAPMVPGTVQEVTIGLSPTSVLLRAGHSIRIAVAGQDASTFARIPAEGTPTLTVAHGPDQASRIELPIAPRGR